MRIALLLERDFPAFGGEHRGVEVDEGLEDVGGLLLVDAGVGAVWVRPDPEKIRQLGVRPILGNFISQSSVVRHDPEKLSAAIIQLINRRANPLFWFHDRHG